MSLRKADLYIDIICITQNKIVKNRKKKQYITKKSLNKNIYILIERRVKHIIKVEVYKNVSKSKC